MVNEPLHRRRILVVDDDASYRDALISGLKNEGFSVTAAQDGRSALEQFKEFKPDAILLDLRLPDIPGTEVCRQIHAVSDVPILMFSAIADEVDVVLSLELGADDYITKPLRLKELIARIEVAFRRRNQAHGDESRSLPTGNVTLGPLQISLDARVVELDGTPMPLSRKEFDLLAVLASRPGRVITRHELMEKVWQSESADDRTLDTHMHRLRSKIERDPAHPALIVTVRGIGFLLRDQMLAPHISESSTGP